MSAPDGEITLRQLQVPLAFMEAGNLSRAAERLETSTVSVHRALHALKQALGCVLFRQEAATWCQRLRRSGWPKWRATRKDCWPTASA